jgi:hypothetical protein
MLHGYTDSDWTMDLESTFGYCFSLGSTMISWSSRKQGSIAHSTAEAEYFAASIASRKVLKYCNCKEYSIYYLCIINQINPLLWIDHVGHCK